MTGLPGSAGRDDIANLARVGLARAHLNIWNDTEVMRYAAQVPADFVRWVEYGINSGENILYSRTHGNNHSLGVHPDFLNGTFGEEEIVEAQTDPRVQHTADWSYGHNALTKLYKPFQSLPYSGFNGETIAEGGEPVLVERDTDIKLGVRSQGAAPLLQGCGPGRHGSGRHHAGVRQRPPCVRQLGAGEPLG